MGVSDILKRMFLTQEVKKLKFYIILLQNSKFCKLKYVHVVEPWLDIWNAKFQADISFFGKHIGQKMYPWMTSFFQIAIFSISRHRTEKQMTFLESKSQTGSETDIFIKKKTNRNFGLM